MSKICKALGRLPDEIIGKEENPYLLRWHVIPKNRIFNIYLHKFCRSDDDRALHDHPWIFNMSILLKGQYIEHRLNKSNKVRRPGNLYIRPGKSPHRVQLYHFYLEDRKGSSIRHEYPVWTLFITGAKCREWGFYCPKGWRHWKEFVAKNEHGNEVGRGCD